MVPPAPDTDQQADAGPRPQAASLPLASEVVPAWALFPLRLFLGLTFIDAGLGKLLSPAYFGAGPRGFATLAESFEGQPACRPCAGSGAGHPFLFALLLAVLELVAGICTVIGLASRLAAGVGLGLSLTFFLTAGWQVRPFFYGADLPFAAGWLTLLLAGHGGQPSVDATLLRRYRSERGLAAAGKAAGMALVTLAAAAGAAPLVAGREEPHAAGQRSGRQRGGYLWEVPVGQVMLFELPRSREPAILVRLAKDQLVAYRAICTHARCLVGFDPNSRLIVCACHGAEFDPCRGAAVVAGPAPRPLPRVELRVDDDAVYVQG